MQTASCPLSFDALPYKRSIMDLKVGLAPSLTPAKSAGIVIVCLGSRPSPLACGLQPLGVLLEMLDIKSRRLTVLSTRMRDLTVAFGLHPPPLVGLCVSWF